MSAVIRIDTSVVLYGSLPGPLPATVPTSTPPTRTTVRPETWQKWHGPAAGSTMFLSPNEQVSVENLLHGIVTLSGNDASVVLAECIAGTEQAFAGQMNALGLAAGLGTTPRFVRTGVPTGYLPPKVINRAFAPDSPGPP